MFDWAEAPKDLIEGATTWLATQVSGWLPPGYLRSFLTDGLIAGAGGVIVFLPQILILFFFILVLEESGYLPRAAFLLDRIMGGVGLSGRSFIPLLSSFACAIPGIMAARTIANPRDRLVTIMIAPMMTCSARLPVYALLIGAFIPQRKIAGGFELQGLVLFALYLAGIVGSLLVAWILKYTTARGVVRPLMMELPTYHWPHVRNVALGLWQRAEIFLRRVGTIILTLTVALWFLASFPAPPPGATQPAIEYSLAGMLGHGLSVVLAPIGFNWQISIALVPGLAAREVAVSALGTVYALSATGDATAQALAPIIAHAWSLGHRLVPAGLVRVRAAVHGDTGHGEARDRRLEVGHRDGCLPVRAGLHRVLRDLPDRAGPGLGLVGCRGSGFAAHPDLHIRKGRPSRTAGSSAVRPWRPGRSGFRGSRCAPRCPRGCVPGSRARCSRAPTRSARCRP